MSSLTKSRDEAWQLLKEFVESPSLRRHCLAVESAMRAYARRFGESEHDWGIVGLIHDFDYERHPTSDLHPAAGAPLLRERGYPEWVVRAILSHADYLEMPREAPIEKTLYAVDELTGLIAAVALVRPSRSVADVTVASVRKKMKNQKFAAAINRDDLVNGAEELGLDFDTHVRVVLDAMTADSAVLGLAGDFAKPDAESEPT